MSEGTHLCTSSEREVQLSAASMVVICGSLGPMWRLAKVSEAWRLAVEGRELF